ncbi:MAG: DUF4838 domain-containing protein [Spirochaetaceae bacterium]|jgi:hypothetical protein|nr:DUF4838 domain-containing protein [Spirochaetaceae bacterium]
MDIRISELVPRHYYLFHKGYFRMKNGKRLKDHHFCTTNPAAIRLLQAEFRKKIAQNPDCKAWTLVPDPETPSEDDTLWCSCPACRAFSAKEQNRMAVNAAAEILEAEMPDAILYYYEADDDSGEEPDISMRANTSSNS